MKKRISAILLALCLSLTLFPAAALAADETGGGAVVSKNAGAQHYPAGGYDWGHTVNSYLCENESGGLTRVEYVNNKVVVEDYSSLFTYISGRTIEPELNKWGGFFAGEKYNFLIFGQNNPKEDNSVEVIRVVKYDKDWKRLGAVGLNGGNTWRPFDAGSLRCAEYNGTLYIRTCHELYNIYGDGLHHQASMMMKIDEEAMKIDGSWVTPSCPPYGYASHSWNQYIMIDQEGRVICADHGDAYPRSIALWQNGKGTTIQALPGAKGNNTTGASFGGLAETTNGYVTAYNYDGVASSKSPRRIYFGYTAKDGLKTTTKALTDEGVAGKTPVLASTGLDGGYILWNGAGEFSNTLYYAAYSDGGTVDDKQTVEGVSLSDCQPVYYNDQVVWYTTNNSGPVFYTLDENGVEALAWDRVICETHEPDESAGWVSAGNGKHGYRCTVCQRVVETVDCEYGEEIETKAPTCTEPGAKTAACTVCGYEKTFEGEPALGGEHEFALNGEGKLVCKRCGEAVPDTKTQVYKAYEAVQKISLDDFKIDAGKTNEEIESAVKAQIEKLLEGITCDSVDVKMTERGTCTVSVVVEGVSLPPAVKTLKIETDDETYYISIPAAENGEIIPSARYAAQGERVTLNVHPSDGYELTDISVTDLRGRAVTLRKMGGSSYSFTMPDTRVTVDAKFAKAQTDTPSDAKPGADAPAEDEPFTALGTPGISGIALNPAAMTFLDVRTTDWFYNSVDYVWKHYLMSGVSDTQFAPDDTTTRAMIWTVLARMNNVRTDVNPGPNWYERGMLWAMEQGITDGSDPMGNITREQLATMLWRGAGSPGVPADLSGFSDSDSVSDYAQAAVNWAVANGILNGSDGKLEPQGTATRAQVAAMVMRYSERIGA